METDGGGAAPARLSIFGRLEAALAAIGTGWILVLMLLICADIIGRAAFKAPILGVPEMVQFSIVGIVFLQLPLTLRTGALTRSDILLGAVKRKAPRLGHGLQFAFDLTGCALLTIIVVTTLPLARQAFANREFFGSTGVVHIPTGPLKMIIILGCAAMALQFLLHALGELRAIRAGRP
jgi:TRAP-type mannitol/chloroaromatic compound transport system permease small subunit